MAHYSTFPAPTSKASSIPESFDKELLDIRLRNVQVLSLAVACLAAVVPVAESYACTACRDVTPSLLGIGAYLGIIGLEVRGTGIRGVMTGLMVILAAHMLLLWLMLSRGVLCLPCVMAACAVFAAAAIATARTRSQGRGSPSAYVAWLGILGFMGALVLYGYWSFGRHEVEFMRARKSLKHAQERLTAIQAQDPIAIGEDQPSVPSPK